MRRIKEKTDVLHPAAYGVILYMLVGIARLPELYPFLKPLLLGKIALVIAIIGLLKANKSEASKISDDKIVKLMIFFSILAIISVSYSLWISHSLNFVMSRFLSILLMFYLIIKSTTNHKTFRAYIKTFILCGVLLSIETIRLKGLGRLSVGSSYDPNDLAQVMCVILPFVIVFAFTSKTKVKYIYFILSVTLLFTILLTGSRGGLLGLFIVLPFLLKSLVKDFKSFMKIIAVAVLGVFIGIALAPDYTVDRFNSMFNLEEDYNVTGEKGRLAIWERGIDTMISKPYGVGINAFTSAEGQAGGRNKAAHNMFIQVGVELGVIGLIIFLLLLKNAFSVLNNILKTATQDSTSPPFENIYMIALALRSSLLAYVVTGFFLSCAYTSLLFFLFGIIAVLKINQKRLFKTNE